jgi:D-aminopeptidase
LACPVQITAGDQTAFAEALDGALQEATSACQAATQALEAELAITVDAAAANASERLGISPWLEVSLTQEAEAPDSPQVPAVEILLAGIATGGLIWAVAEWRAGRRDHQDEGVA